MTPEEEAAIDAFEDAWQAGEEPDIARYVGLGRALVEELIKIDLEYRWRRGSGGGPRLDEYFARFGEVLGAVEEAPADLLAEEYRVRRRWGDRATAAEAASRFPARARELTAAFTRVAGDVPLPAPPAAVTGEGAAVAGYDILGELGRGGMGVVYKALQRSLGRMVALKMILSAEHAGPRERERFRAEAEAAGRLQHPHIVQVYEIGEDGGRPFCAMELVSGGSLAEHLRGVPLEPEPAARLTQALARGVQAAHARNVIHRDLKPGNVLLGRLDGVADPLAMPKIADFGLAKLLDETVPRTLTGAVLGTPSYMAPEQAQGRANDAGAAADIYALGAILYELLTGRPPFRGATTIETLEQVRFQEPVAPRKLQPRVPRDLETIALKCLAKEPRKRYATAEALAGDLESFVRGEPIRARPTSAAERAMKWARRRKAAAALLALSAVFVVTGVAAAFVHSARLQAAFRRIESQRERADANLEKAFDAVSRLLDRVGFERLENVPHMDDRRRQLLEDSLELYQVLLADQDTRSARLERAYVHANYRLGMIQLALGDQAGAAASLEKFLSLLAASPHLSAGAAERAVEEARGRDGAARASFALGEHARCVGHLRAAAALLEGLRDPPWWARQDLAVVYNSLAVRGGGPKEEFLRKALAVREAVAAERPDDLKAQSFRAESLFNIGLHEYEADQYGPAEEHLSEAAALFADLSDKSTDPDSNLFALAECSAALGFLLRDRDRGEAERRFQGAIAARERLVQAHPRNAGYCEGLARSYHNLASFYQLVARGADAEDPLRKAIAVHEKLARDHPETGSHQGELADHYAALAMTLHGTGKLAEARRHFEKAVAVLQGAFDRDPAPRRGMSLAACETNFGNLLVAAGEVEEAIRRLDRAVSVVEGAYAAHAGARDLVLNARGSRALALGAAGRYADAVGDWDRVVELEKNESERLRHRVQRASVLAKAGEQSRLQAEAKELTRLETFAPAYRASLISSLGLAISAALADDRLGAAERDQAVAAHRQNAADNLNRLAETAYYVNVQHFRSLRTDPTLEPLRDTEVYRKIVKVFGPMHGVAPEARGR